VKPDTKRKILGNDPESLGYVAAPASDPERVALREENALLKDRLDRLERMLERIVDQGDGDGSGQGEASEEQPEPTVSSGRVRKR